MSGARYRKGRRLEYRTMRVLEAAGYTCARTAGSHGAWDVIAWNEAHVRFIQVKAGSARMSLAEREGAGLEIRPPGSSAELWRWPDRSREPLIERLYDK